MWFVNIAHGPPSHSWDNKIQGRGLSWLPGCDRKDNECLQNFGAEPIGKPKGYECK